MPVLTAITPSGCLDLLLAVAPRFPDPWLRHLDTWRREETGLKLGLAEYAKFIVDLLEAGHHEALPAIFDTVESLLLQGDARVREAVATHLLATLLNMDVYAHAVAPYWGPRTRLRCAELDPAGGYG